MPLFKSPRMWGVITVLAAVSNLTANAQEIKKVFVIAMENHNWTQPANQFSGNIQQIYKNPSAPFINSLVDGTASAKINGSVVHISEQVAYATAYYNVLATASGNNPHIHPSEPSYIWAEAGDNFGVLNDRDPYSVLGPTNQTTSQHLCTLLTKAGKTWRSYQEDIDLAPKNGQLTNLPLPQNDWTVPLISFSGVFGSGINQYNGSNQYNYATKHNPQLFFIDTNGDGNLTPANPLSTHYAPLQQLAPDLASNSVADYNWITPDQYNDMHTPLNAGYKGLTGDAAEIKQGDDFLSRIIPIIMASDAYKKDGVIIIWFDESEPDGNAGDNSDNFNHPIPEIVVSPRAHANVKGVPYASAVNYTHSSDLRTLQEIFHAGPFLGDAAKATVPQLLPDLDKFLDRAGAGDTVIHHAAPRVSGLVSMADGMSDPHLQSLARNGTPV